MTINEAAIYAVETKAVVYAVFALAVIFAIAAFHLGVLWGLQVWVNRRMRSALSRSIRDARKEREASLLLVAEVEKLRKALEQRGRRRDDPKVDVPL